MGTDIHCFVEKKTKEGNWEQITGFRSGYYDCSIPYFSKECFKSGADSPIDVRNYDEFAVLANVRNSDRIKPIDLPRGLPKDVTPLISKYLNNRDIYSVSYLIVRELMDYDKNISIKKHGYVDAENYLEFLANGRPKNWCSDIVGEEVVKCSNSEIIEKSKSYQYCYSLLQWDDSIKYRCRNLFGNCLDQLKNRCDSKNYDDVRIVFGFSS